MAGNGASADVASLADDEQRPEQFKIAGDDQARHGDRVLERFSLTS